MSDKSSNPKDFASDLSLPKGQFPSDLIEVVARAIIEKLHEVDGDPADTAWDDASPEMRESMYPLAQAAIDAVRSYKSAPAVTATQNTAEGLPSSDAAGTGADTLPARTVAQAFLDDHQDVEINILDYLTDMVVRARNDGLAAGIAQARADLGSPYMLSVAHRFLETLQEKLDDFSPDETIGIFGNGVWVGLATVDQIREAASSDRHQRWARALAMRRAMQSWSEMAAKLGVSVTTAKYYVERAIKLEYRGRLDDPEYRHQLGLWAEGNLSRAKQFLEEQKAEGAKP